MSVCLKCGVNWIVKGNCACAFTAPAPGENAEAKALSAEELDQLRKRVGSGFIAERLLATIDARDAEIERLQMDGIHICSSQCRRTACVLRREIDALKARAEAAERRAGELERLLKAMTELASENDDDAGKAQDERDIARAEAARLAALLREVLGAPKSPTCYLGLMNRIREQLAVHESAMRVVGRVRA